KTAEIFVLDCRGEREPSSILLGNGDHYISPEQMDWLKTGLLQSPARFKLILNSVPISMFPFSIVNFDGWVRYPANRDEILSFIDDNTIPGVVWVAGDHHFASSGRISALGAGSSQLEVLVGPGAQQSSPLVDSLFGSQWDFKSG